MKKQNTNKNLVFNKVTIFNKGQIKNIIWVKILDKNLIINLTHLLILLPAIDTNINSNFLTYKNWKRLMPKYKKGDCVTK
jgi:hypothetical protein